MAYQIIKSGLVAMGALAALPASADEHDLATLIGQHVLRASEDQGHLASTASFAREAVTTCAQHAQAVSEMADRFRETRQVQSLLTLAQQSPAAARDVRTRVATMMIDRLISEGEDALPALVEDLAAEVLFACYEGALLAAQNVPQPDAPPAAEVMQPDQAEAEAEPPALVIQPPALTPSSTLEPSSRPVSRPAPSVAQDPEPAPPLALETMPPEPQVAAAEPPSLSPSEMPEPSSRPTPRPVPIVTQEAESAPPEAEVALPEPELPALSPSLGADAPAAVAEPAQPDPEPTAERFSWGVILTAQNSREAAELQTARIAGLIPEEQIDYAQMRVPGHSDLRHVARVGRASRDEAEELCSRLKSQGAACIVLKN